VFLKIIFLGKARSMSRFGTDKPEKQPPRSDMSSAKGALKSGGHGR
jgi:hypothetical protein